MVRRKRNGKKRQVRKIDRDGKARYIFFGEIVVILHNEWYPIKTDEAKRKKYGACVFLVHRWGEREMVFVFWQVENTNHIGIYHEQQWQKQINCHKLFVLNREDAGCCVIHRCVAMSVYFTSFSVGNVCVSEHSKWTRMYFHPNFVYYTI